MQLLQTEAQQMTGATVQGDEISLFALGTMLLRHRWRIARWMLIGAVLAALSVIAKPALYVASASFLPQGGDTDRSGLAGIAGQFGVSLPTSNQSLSPDFYAKLLTSRVVLLPIIRDTFTVPELGRKRMTFPDLFEIRNGSPARREELGDTLLKRMVAVSIDKPTGVVQFSVGTKWRSVSLAIVTALLNGVNDYNQRQRKGQATVERQFIEGRLVLASDDLRTAEDNLQRFLEANRNLDNSPELMLQRERLERAVSLRQQVFISLNQSYEDARAREVRDAPVVTVFEPPSVPTVPAPRGRLKRVALGLLLGGGIGVLLAFMSGMMARYRTEGSVEANEFIRTLSEIKGEIRGRVRSLRMRA